MAYIASHLQSEDKHKKLSMVFRDFDTDGDGKLEREELIEGFLKLGISTEHAVAIVDEILDKIDINRNGSIDYSEFLMANLSREEALSQTKLREAFALFDIVRISHKLSRMATGK